MSTILEQLLANHSSPAICGLKASNLINIKYNDSIYNEIEELNKLYPSLCFYILKKENDMVLILIYRKKVLEKKLFENDNKSFLKQLGYDTTSVESMLLCLKERMKKDEFPHEIGVFLGYDLSDIKSFIKGNKCLYVGYWKVYSNLEEKMKLFNKYTKCREIVMKMIDKGFPLENFMR
jgi:hypothetical protein